MHRPILGAGLRALALTALAGVATAETIDKPGACPAPGAAVHELFIAADCADCWAEPGAAGAEAPGAWRFDWIVPGNDDAPMAAGALRDSPQRLARAGRPLPTAGTQQAHRQAAGVAPRAPVRLSVSAGLPMNGYYALQLSLTRRPGQALPAGSTGWLALVEAVPAGRDGTPVARALVRSVAGPLALPALRPGQTLNHLAAMRWPEGTQVDRLQARAWIESADGRLLAVAGERCGP